MALSLTSFKTSLPPALLRKAEKCTVRECDETAKGNFEAYVDEGADSFDVMVRLNKAKELTEHRCDCGSTEALCHHVLALLLTLAGKTAAKAPSVKGKKTKQSKTELLLEAADADELKAWLKEVLNKHKDLALAFEQRFGEKKTVYTKEEAEALTATAVKSVIKNRTRVEQAELKKIVETWTEVHKPVVEAYLANVAGEEGFVAFHAVLDSSLEYAYKLSATGVKIPNYVQSLLDQAVEPIAQLFGDEAFETATGFYHNHIPDGANRVRLHYVLHLQKLLSVGTPERLAAGIEKLVWRYGGADPDHLFHGADYTKALFAFVEANGFLPRYLSVFKPIRFDNAFNALLIEKLIASGALDLAEKYAKAQIAANYRDEYNLPYLELLKKIHRLQNNEDALAEVTEKLLPFTFDFDDYLFVYNRMPEGEEKKKWRTKLITKAKQGSSYGRTGAEAFYFRLLDHEQRYKKMIEEINYNVPYHLVLAYFEPMALTDKTTLLKKILDKSEDYGWFYSERSEEDKNCFPDLAELMEKTYGRQILLATTKQLETGRFYSRSNRFVAFLKKTLAES